MRNLLFDVRYVCRVLRKSPGFTLIVLLTIGLGIGANTTMFSFLHAYLLRPLPFPEPGRLAHLAQDFPEKGLTGSTSYPNFEDWRTTNESFENLMAYDGERFNLTGGNEPERVAGVRVTAGFFSVLGAEPAAGRIFLPEDDRSGAEPVAILSWGLWQRRFGGQPDVLGSDIMLDGVPHTVVGIMPASFRFPDVRRTLWTPLAADYNQWHRGNQSLKVVGRLKPGAPYAAARAEMETIAGRLEEQFPEANKGWGITMVPLEKYLTRYARAPVLVLMGAVGFVLLIACANVANMLLARVTARRKEISIHTALGASRFRAVRHVLSESLVLSLLGGAIGFALSIAGIRMVVAGMAPYMLPVGGIQVEPAVLGFTILLSLLTGLIFGLTPAIQASRANANDALKEGGRTSASSHGRLRRALVVSEVALALLLLVGAGLLMKSLAGLLDVDPGFRKENVITAGITLPEIKYGNPEQRSTFFVQLQERTSRLPGVLGSGAASQIPMRGRSSSGFLIEGRPKPAPGEFIHASNIKATPGYFQAMGIPLRRGRGITERDSADSERIVVINETMARRFWPNEDPVGQRICLDSAGEDCSRIAGIVGDIHYFEMEWETPAEMYYPHRQRPSDGMVVAVRTAADPSGIVNSLRAVVRELDPDLPITQVQTMEHVVADAMAPQRITTYALGVFGALALALAVMGLYGVISYSVSERTHEYGIRMALGATSANVVQHVLRSGLTLVGTGLAIGLAGAFAVTRLMSALLHGVSPTDPLIFASVPVVLALAAVAATYLPARRASRTHPMVALRYE